MPTTTVYEAIQATNVQLVEAFSAGDAAAVAACYTTNCLLMPPGTEMITGRAGVQAYWQGAMNMGPTGA